MINVTMFFFFYSFILFFLFSCRDFRWSTFWVHGLLFTLALVIPLQVVTEGLVDCACLKSHFSSDGTAAASTAASSAYSTTSDDAAQSNKVCNIFDQTMCYSSTAGMTQFCKDRTIAELNRDNDPVAIVKGNHFHCVNTPNATNIVCSSLVQGICYDAADLAGQKNFCSWYYRQTDGSTYGGIPSVTNQQFYCK
jgi:hypothetical protein